MDEQKIENPTDEEVTVETQYAGFWRRAGAHLIDYLLTLFVCFGLTFMVHLAYPESNPYIAQAIFFFLWLAYYSILEASTLQGTMGKFLCGIKVENYDGKRISIARSFCRNLSKIISCIILLIGFIMAGFTAKKQTLHDMMTKCVVVRTGRKSHFWKVFIVLIIIWIGIGVALGSYFVAIFKEALQESVQEIEQFPQDLQEDFRRENIVDNGDSKQIFAPISVVTQEAKTSFEKINEQEYDAMLSKGEVSFDGEQHISLGAIAFKISTFFSGQDPMVWLKIRTANIPNVEHLKHHLEIKYVLGEKDGKNYTLYNKHSSFEKGSFKNIILGKKKYKNSNSNEYFEGVRSVRLLKGSKEEYVKGISGVLTLSMPVNIETLSFTVDQIGQELETNNAAKIKLISFNGDRIAIEYDGKAANFLKLVAYDTNSNELAPGISSIANKDGVSKLNFSFKGTPATFKLAVAEKIYKKINPFHVGEKAKKK